MGELGKIMFYRRVYVKRNSSSAPSPPRAELGETNQPHGLYHLAEVREFTKEACLVK